MHRAAPLWPTLLYILAVFLIIFSLGPLNCAITESRQLQRVREAEFPTVEVDLSQPGVTTVPLPGPFLRRDLRVMLRVAGEMRASEQTLGDFAGSVEMVRTSDGTVTWQWSLENDWWTDHDDASVTGFEFRLLHPDAHEVRLTVLEPAAQLKEARIEIAYSIDSMDGAFIPLWWMISGGLALAGLLIIAVVLLIRRLQRMGPINRGNGSVGERGTETA